MKTLLALCVVACVVGATPRNMRDVQAEINRLDTEITALKQDLAAVRSQQSSPQSVPSSGGGAGTTVPYVTAIWGYRVPLRERNDPTITPMDEIVVFRAWSNGVFETLTQWPYGNSEWVAVKERAMPVPGRRP